MSHPISNQDTSVLVLRIYKKEGHEENIRAFFSFLSQLSFNKELYFTIYETETGFHVKVGLDCSFRNQEILKDMGYAVRWFLKKKKT